ncbi:uncharacterized protein [Dysidea avara]|uniref:uncharacterized protein n=1 Tax=Dysidea avara TaxID=196820 RepID=UPI00331FC232
MSWQRTLRFFLVIIVLEGHQVDSTHGICYKTTSSYRMVANTLYQVRYQSNYDAYRCGSFGWRRCTRYFSTSYSQSYITYNQSIYYTNVTICCPGYEGEPPICHDINECASSNGGCQHNCTNTIGSYYCTCANPTGYTLNEDGHNCTDINECKISNGGCHHHCTNTNGSYYCSCVDGYSLKKDYHNCSQDEDSLNYYPAIIIGVIFGFLVISIVAVSVMYMGFIALLITCHRNKNMNKVYPQQSTLATQSPQNPARWNTSNATNNGSRLSSTSRPTLSPTEMCVVIQHLLALHIQDIGNLSTYIQP